jgi:hypothetical protein
MRSVATAERSRIQERSVGAVCLHTSEEVSDMTRLAERLGYLWQRYVAWHDPRPFKRES